MVIIRIVHITTLPEAAPSALTLTRCPRLLRPESPCAPPLPPKMTSIAEVASVGKGNALGHGVKSLGDGVKTGAGAEGNSGGVAVGVAVVSISISVSRSLADIVTIVAGIAEVAGVGEGNSLGHGVKSLGDGVQASAGAEGHTSIGVGVAVVGIGISTSLNGSNQASQSNRFEHCIFCASKQT